MTDKTRTMPKQSGIGTIPTAEGVTFRVSGPHAEKVYVIGIFSDWSTTATPLAREENGCWSSEVTEAKAGDEYRYMIYSPVDRKLPPFFRIAPSAG